MQNAVVQHERGKFFDRPWVAKNKDNPQSDRQHFEYINMTWLKDKVIP